MRQSNQYGNALYRIAALLHQDRLQIIIVKPPPLCCWNGQAKHPMLSIDNCASGGRRIDLETLRRSGRVITQCTLPDMLVLSTSTTSVSSSGDVRLKLCRDCVISAALAL